jgi:hypothetical protein
MGEQRELLSDDEDARFLGIAVPIAAFVGGLCCVTPVVTVLFGLGSVAYATSLTEVLYGEYRWAFRLAGLCVIGAAFVVHSYSSKNVCSVDAAVRRRRELLTLFALAVGLATLAYIVWLYVIVELAGIALGIW